jgi:hypothetical protein
LDKAPFPNWPLTSPHLNLACNIPAAAAVTNKTRYEDKEVQRDKKLVSYDIVDKQGKPYVKVNIGKEDKVRQFKGRQGVG